MCVLYVYIYIYIFIIIIIIIIIIYVYAYIYIYIYVYIYIQNSAPRASGPRISGEPVWPVCVASVQRSRFSRFVPDPSRCTASRCPFPN